MVRPKGMRASAVCVGARACVGPAALHHLAAGSAAGRGVLDLGPALTLAGVHALARRGAAALAGALALAGVGAGALHAFGVRGGGESASSEDRSGRRDQRTLVHEDPPECASLCARIRMFVTDDLDVTPQKNFFLCTRNVRLTATCTFVTQGGLFAGLGHCAVPTGG